MSKKYKFTPALKKMLYSLIIWGAYYSVLKKGSWSTPEKLTKSKVHKIFKDIDITEIRISFRI